MSCVPPSIPGYRFASGANGVGVHATVLLAASALTGCGAEDATEPVCPAVAYISVMTIDAPGFGARYRDELPLLVDACPAFLECETFRMRSAANRADPVDCDAEPGTSEGQCELGGDDTLHLVFELPYSVHSLQGDRAVTVTLRSEDGTPFAENGGQVRFDLQYADGEDCGPTHAVAQLELETAGWLAK